MIAIDSAELEGCQIGRYTVVGLIGTGGMARVYRARDTRLQRDVALKIAGSSGAGPGHDSLIDEARVLSRLNHPNIAAILDFFTDAGREVIVMDFVPGATLKAILASGPLPAPEVIRLGSQLLRGLSAAHEADVIHRDIKPANVKITSAGELKILDFGVAALLPRALAIDTTCRTSSGPSVAGTIPYMAPEQLRGEPLDARSDIFGAGAVLYEMATGRPAFPQKQFAGLVEAVLHAEPAKPCAANPFVPRALSRLIMQALQKDPGDRQASAAALAAELESLTPDFGTLPPAGPARWWRTIASAF